MAGFFDGEGNIYLHHCKPSYSNAKGQYALWITITQSDEAILKDFLAFGEHVYKNKWLGPKRTGNYFWRVTGLKAKPFLEAILPYLRLKREVAIIALKFIDTLMTKEDAKKIGLSEELIKERDSLLEKYRKIQPLTMRGRKLK